LTIFVQNYKKSVESSSLSIIVPIAVGVIIFLIEKANEKKNASTTAKRPSPGRRLAKTVNPHVEAESRRAEAARHAALSRRRTAARAAEEALAAMKAESEPASAPLPEEGVRVTADKPAREPERKVTAIPPVLGGDLRKAIIWSEILKRKF